jgi:methyl-accepting chemotaxis protein
VEQAAAAAESLEEQAQSLSGTVDGFKVDGNLRDPGSSFHLKPVPKKTAPARTAAGNNLLASRNSQLQPAYNDEWEEF